MSSARKPKTINPDRVDPSVYYYDEVYDDMKEQQESDRSKHHKSSDKDRPRASKYIDGLRETAELRKTEKELRKFKKYARDREAAEAEGDIAQEDVYISESYKRKLAQIEQLEADKRRRQERDQDRTMNFMKSSGSKSSSSDHRRQATSDSKLKSKSRSDANSRSRSHSPETAAEEPERSSPSRPVRKRPRTIEERRRYLRDVLKKRTVGKVYDEAVRRYMQRKASMQH